MQPLRTIDKKDLEKEPLHRMKRLYPMIGRSVGTPLIPERLDSDSFKPEKETVSHEELHGPVKKNTHAHGDPPITGRAHSFAQETAKDNAPTGRKNDQWPGGELGFANGQYMTVQSTPGFHYGRKRLFRQEPVKKNQYFFRLGNPSHATTEKRGPLGHVRVPFNRYVKEDHREPASNAGEISNRHLCNQPNVVLQPVQVHHQAYVGPATAVTNTKHPMRMYRDVIPNKTSTFSIMGNAKGGVTSMKGGYLSNPITLTPTHRECFVEEPNHYSNPAPFMPSKGEGAMFHSDYTNNRVNMKAMTDGKDVMRPPNPLLDRNAIADANRSQRINQTYLRQTQKMEDVYDRKPFLSTVSYKPQYGHMGAIENRQLIPQIQNHIDPSLIQPYRQNPYTQPIPS